MFRKDESGGIAVIFGLALPVLMAGVGGAVEMTRSAAFKQRLTSATELACNQGAVYVSAQRKIDLTKDYSSDVKTIATTSMAQKQIAAADFTLVQPAVNKDVTTVHLEVVGRMAFLIGTFLPMSSSEYKVTRDCLITPNASLVPELLFKESFEDGHSVSYNGWDVLRNWHGWTTTNAGIEVNGMPSLGGNTIRDGNFFAELDSDCNTWANSGVQNCQSNSAMSLPLKQLTTGDYQIRYYYIARHGYVNTAPYGVQPICSDMTKPQGSQRGDFASQASSNAYIKAAENDGETFRIEVFVDKSSDVKFSTSNLMDACIWSDTWIERQINFKITTYGDYVISWRAAGRQDTYGGLIDAIRICRGVCP